MSTWTVEQLQRIDATRELEISSETTAAKPPRWLPIWVVCVDGEVYVRTWYRRTTGWYGRATRTGHARIRVAGLELAVDIDDLGARAPTEAINSAYVRKYGGGGSGGMVSDETVATTLRLVPAS